MDEDYDEDEHGLTYRDVDGVLQICDGGLSCDGSCPGWG